MTRATGRRLVKRSGATDVEDDDPPVQPVRRVHGVRGLPRRTALTQSVFVLSLPPHHRLLDDHQRMRLGPW